MLTNDDVSRAMDDIARMAAQAGVLTQRFEEPSSADQATLLEQILLVDRLGSTRIAHRKNLKIGVAALGLAASLAIGVAVIEQQGASGPFRADTPGATATDSAQSRPKGPATLGPYLSIPETPTEWLVGQVGKDAVIARRISDFVYDAAESRESDQPMGKAQMTVITSLDGQLSEGDTFTAESPLIRHESDWESPSLNQEDLYLLFPDSSGPSTYVVSDDIYRRKDADHYELEVSTRSATVQPDIISISELRALIADK